MISKDTYITYIKLAKERRKLERLVRHTLKEGVPIAEDERILRQSRKVDALIMEMLFARTR